MGKITFESDDPAEVEAFEDRMVEASINCRLHLTGRHCSLAGTPECEACPYSVALRERRDASRG